MTESSLIERQRQLLRDLYRVFAERGRDEPRVESDLRARTSAAEKAFQEGTHRVITQFENDKAASQLEFQQTEERISSQYTAERTRQDKELAEKQHKAGLDYDAEVHAAELELQETRRSAVLKRKANRAKADKGLDEARAKIDETLEKNESLKKKAKALVTSWRQERDYGHLAEGEVAGRKYHDAFKRLEESLETAEAQFEELQQLRLPRWFEGMQLAVMFVVLALLAGALGGVIGGREAWIFGLVSGLGGFLLIGGGLVSWLFGVARNQVAEAYVPLLQILAEIEKGSKEARAQARSERQTQVSAAQKVFDQQVKIATDKERKAKQDAKEKRDALLLKAQEKRDREEAESVSRRDTGLRQAHEKYQKLRAAIFERYETESHELHQVHYQQLTEAKRLHEVEWAALAAAWRQGFADVHAVVDAVNRETQALFKDWNDPAWQTWVPTRQVPPVLPIGTYRVLLQDIPPGLPSDERLKPAADKFELPALLPFPGRCALVLRSDDKGRTQAARALQSAMLRYLTMFPPGKVRFTIIDPVGLGENFAAFMHLADYDEALVNNKIWTEAGHIEQRMADLTAHMEVVIQKYLRNEFQTIEEYNAHAGEVAEPFRVPVIANFPCNFSTEAARRLVSIVASGARCGVFPVISVDTTQEFPTGFSLANLEQNAASLVWQGDRYVWQDPDFGKFALDLATPPSDEFSTRLLQKVGELAKQAKRVEVPFDFIAPPPEQWWTSQSGPGIDVALGRVGATKRQHLRLGQGTSQHVLVAGKTGSGKSTLMHALITNLTLSYSPEELELYLIDFKKGVEFKSYASSELPHARVIAIEGEREFGLSVLQRLDVELKRRAEMFREAGVQDVKSFREARPKEPLPRILLIVDEFQEFFVEDDKISQDCSQLLDRLVRQGRAFGLHLLLGSQTLGGAYTLARSTIDQMAVRIALQCSEVDANLILSDDNSAARLLSRPGEAIYNDANGLVEGNNPFQVVWLSEARREQLLERVRDLDRQRNSHRKRTQVVFEGNAPARIEQNAQILSLLAGPSWPTGLEAFQAWLGDPIAIQAPTSATFRRQTGANLLAIGQDESLALGISLSSLISLALQHAPATAANLPSEARFILFDGTPPGTSLTGTLARCSQLLQHSIRVAGWRELDQVLGELLEELERRQKNEETVGATQYLFIHGLQRFRDLRRDESDFGFSSGESKPAPDKKLATLLREGPGLGIHTIVWCDTLNNATRAFDRSSMREFEMHVLLQMSANDSSNLIDSPLAAKLGANRAYVHSEEQSKLEKFRPYGLPKEEWLTKVGEILRGR